jgi:hypothetical protein
MNRHTSPRHSRIVIALVLAALAYSARAQEQLPRFTGTLNNGSLVIGGVTPRGSVAIFAIIREAKAYYVAVRRIDQIVADADGDGRVQVEARTTLSDRAVYSAVDLTSGAYVVASPDPQGVTTIDSSEFSFPGKGLGQLLHMEINRGVLDVLIVRAGNGANATGAWKGRLVDGAASDADKRVNNYSRMEFDALMPLIADGPKKMQHALPGDTIVLVDPRSLHVLAGRIGVEVVP